MGLVFVLFAGNLLAEWYDDAQKEVPRHMLNLQAALPAAEQVTHLGLKTSEWIMVAAIIIGPFAAVVTQLYVQQRREKRNQKLWVFSTLMSLRAAVLHPDYVRALNNIDVVFYDNEKVRARWKTVLEYLSSPDWGAEIITPETLDRTRDLGAELLAEMARDLNYSYDHTHIKANAYYPRGHFLIENQLAEIRRQLIEVLNGRANINFRVS